ncbi:hypothetical protein ABPG74_014959 [Tetrahymena malaccensis]
MSSEFLNDLLQQISQKVKNEQNIIFQVNKQEVIYKNKSIEDIEKEIDERISQNQDDVECLMIKEQILYKYHNNYQLAIQVIQNILKKEQANIDARLDLIQIMLSFQIGKIDQCNVLLQECFLLDQNYWRTHFLEIRVLENLKAADLFLLNKLHQYLLKFEDNFYIFINYLQIFTDYKKMDEKLAQKFSKLIQKQDLDSDLIRKIAYILFNIKKKDESVEFLYLSLKMNPQSFQIYENLGYMLRLNPDTQLKALEYLKQSEKYNDRSKIFFLNMVQVLRNLKQFKLSNEYALKSIKLYQNSENFYTAIIRNYFELNEKENVIYFTQKTLNKFKNNQSVIKLSQRVQSQYFNYLTSDCEDMEQQIINSYNIKNNIKDELYTIFISQIYQQ